MTVRSPARRTSAVPDLDLPGLTATLRAAAEAVDTERRLPHEAIAALRERGLWGARVPAEFGGLDLSPAELFAVCAAIGAGCGVTALLYAQHLTALLFLTRWGGADAPDLLAACARGEAILGLASGQATRWPGGPTQARHSGDRVLMSGTVPWFSGAGLMTHALIAADDPTRDSNDGLALALVPFAPPAVTFSAPLDLIVLGGSQTVAATLTDLDVTAGLLTAPPTRAALRAAMEGSEGPLRGFNIGLAQAALDLCDQTAYASPQTQSVVAWLTTRLGHINSELLDTLSRAGSQAAPDPELQVAATLNLLWDLGRLVVSAGAGSALKTGAPHNRLAREILYYQARTPYSYIAGLIGLHFGVL